MEQVNMSKINAIQAQLERAASLTPPKAANTSTAPSSAARTASREGKTHIGAYLSPGFKSSLRLVQAQTGEDTQTLIARALNELFRSHKVPVVD
jgi:hypothetical protein